MGGAGRPRHAQGVPQPWLCKGGRRSAGSAGAAGSQIRLRSLAAVGSTATDRRPLRSRSRSTVHTHEWQTTVRLPSRMDDARPTVISPTAAAPAAQTTLPPPPFHPARRQNAQQQSPGVSAAFGGRAFGGALTLASAGEYGDNGARMIDTLRADQARLVAEIAQLKTENLRLLASAPAAAVGGSSSAAAHAAGATAPALPNDTLDAEVYSYLANLFAYIAAMGPIRQRQNFQPQYGSGGGSSSRGGGAGGGGASSSSSSSTQRVTGSQPTMMLQALHAPRRRGFLAQPVRKHLLHQNQGDYATNCAATALPLRCHCAAT